VARRKTSEIKLTGPDKSVDVSFEDFLAMWAVKENWDHIPDFHLDIVDFLQNDDKWENNTAVIQMFRNAAKSTIIGVYVVWKLVSNPKLIFVVQSSNNETARKMVSDVQKIITHHPLAKHLSGKKNVWTANGLRVVGATAGRSLSLSAKGIFTSVTGSRADIIIYDDIEVPQNSESADLRDRLRSRVSESAHLLNPNGKRIFVGTPHSFECIYSEIKERGTGVFEVPMLTEINGEWPNMVGKCAWPQRFTDEDIAFKQRECRSRAEFMSQYQLVPMSSEESHLDPDRLVKYNDEVIRHEANRSELVKLGDKLVTHYRSFWDPSLSKTAGDDSVLTIVALTGDGHIYIHRQFAVIGDADQQCKAVRDHLVLYNVPSVVVETNGLGGFLDSNLRKYTRGLKISVVGQHTSKSKSDSISEAFSVPLGLSIVHVHEQVLTGKLVSQLRDFNPNRSKGKDDFVDSAAKAIQLLPVTVGRGVTNKADNFKPFRREVSSTQIEVEYDFGGTTYEFSSD
jgi:hypothetical protein